MARPNRRKSRRELLRRRARELRRSGYRRIAGADEAGVGPLAGPIVAAAVILPPGARLPGVDDSKRLSAETREIWAERIKACAIAWIVREVEVARVDEIGPYHASIEGLTAAVRALDPAPDYLLVDARELPAVDVEQEAVIRGDAKHLAIAAASVLAKVHRDAKMVALDDTYPAYGFATHKGYGTPAHLRALDLHGPCPVHRSSYAPVRRASSGQPLLWGRAERGAGRMLD